MLIHTVRKSQLGSCCYY